MFEDITPYERVLARFCDKCALIAGLELADKISPEEAYQQIKDNCHCPNFLLNIVVLNSINNFGCLNQSLKLLIVGLSTNLSLLNW
jgi:hypothetical protein